MDESDPAGTAPARRLRVLVVDDLAINREGTRAIIGGVEGVDVVATVDFDEALARASWQDIDWVIVDVAQETREDDETPCVPVIEHIRSCAAGPKPQVVAVTANPIAYNEPLIRLRLIQADPDVALLWRRDLEELVVRAVRSADLASGLRDAPALEAPRSHPELGITPRTLINRLFEGAREIADLPPGKRFERQTWRLRDRVTREAKVEPVNQDGTLARNSDAASIRQLRRILDRLRLSDRPRT